MPKPVSRVATFVISTGRRASVSMFASGSGVRRSTATQRASSAIPSARQPSVFGLPQPQRFASEMAISGITSATASSIAPRTSTRPLVRLGDSGMKRNVATPASAAPAAPIQKIQW